MGFVAEVSVVEDRPVGGRVLHQRAEDLFVKGEGCVFSDHDVDAKAGRPRAHDRDGLGMAQLGHEEHLRVFVFTNSGEHVHGLGGGGGFVEQRRICHVHPAKIHDHGLEIEQGLQPPL